ncbi:WD40 repeat domain-containing protein [Candidatus Neomicrothrix sp.]|uniref:WD40 repeat domain-containing protein n=1 Tax=Candidatus Neomicrothrix sp. TaxID=2719034 RepID=UPI003CD0DB2B
MVGGVVTRWHQAGFRVERWDHPDLGPRRWHRTRPSRRPHRRVWSVGWSPDGTRLVSGSNDGTIRIWDPERAHRTRPPRRPH